MELFLVLLFGPMLLLGVGLFGLYKSDPQGWKATGRRISTWTRANLESGKAAKAITKGVTSKDLIKDWDNQYEGKDLVVTSRPVKKHEIVKTRLVPITHGSAYKHWYRWWCRCGASDDSLWEDDALRKFTKTHLAAAKKADEALKKKEEYRKKGLDREW